MGKATRWLKGLFSGGNGEKKNSKTSSDVDKSSSAKEKKVWSFAKSFRDKEGGGGRGLKKDMTSSFHGSGVVEASSASPVVMVMGNAAEQSKRAIAVAAATAAAAEAAVAAAQAAAAVVKLTSTRGSVASGWKREDWAAIKIQAVFRGYLARRALKALRGLVKLQALVRGHIVRKQAVETLRCMQALVRAQSRVRAARTPNKRPNSKNPDATPSTQEKYELTLVRSGNLGKCASKNRKMNAIDPGLLQSSGWSWLDQWMEERYLDSREAASRTGTVTDDEKNEKILEVDSGNPHINCKWKNNHHSVHPSLTSEQNRRSHVTIYDSPSKDSTLAQYSIPSPASVTMQEPTSSIGFSTEAADVYESPQYYLASSRTGSSMKGPFTPSKSECSLNYFSEFSDFPNYMSNTESFKAKARSHSAPRQRPAELKKSSSSIKGSSGYGYVSGELSSSGSQRSSCLHAKFTNKAYPGSGRLDRLGMPHGR